ncbi:MAG: hypothetical protein HFG48_01835, partial [Bacilli bacterium]|nr:hypothetical protein [Bacilli bacterium]
GDALPIIDEDGKKLVPYEFTITNMCNSMASYQINLEVLENTTLPELSIIKILLNEVEKTAEPRILNTNAEVDKTLDNANKSYKIGIGHLAPNTSKSFELRLWIDEDSEINEEYMNKTFNSKVTIITSYSKDKTAPTTSFTATGGVGTITVDASNSSDSESGIKKYYYSIDGEIYIESTESTYTFENLSGSSYTVYVKVEDNVGNISDVKELPVTVKIDSANYIASLEGNGQVVRDETSENNLRYIGANPNNYIKFNNELWRIIGVFNNVDDGTGKKERRIKIIRNSSLGSYSWDSCDVNTNRGYGINEWSQADLNTLLNDYYYNRKSGQNCYIGRENQTKSCSFNTNGITDESKMLIGDTLWNTGNEGFNINETNEKTNAFNYYKIERSLTATKNCTYSKSCNDTVTRKASWIGKIALIYPSDYGFATSGGADTKRETCLTKSLQTWNDMPECFNNNWISKKNEHQWLLGPSTIDGAYHTSVIYSYSSSNYVIVTSAYSAAAVYPALYLKSNVVISSGDGSSSNPFELILS